MSSITITLASLYFSIYRSIDHLVGTSRSGSCMASVTASRLLQIPRRFYSSYDRQYEKFPLFASGATMGIKAGKWLLFGKVCAGTNDS